MKKFDIKIKDKSFDVKVKSIENGSAEVEVNGVNYNVEYEEFIDRKAIVEKMKKKTAAAPAASKSAAAAPKTERKAVATGPGALVAPMPGLILDVYVNVGDQVTDGQIVIKMEAMKMENEIPAPTSGAVSEVHVKKGDTVKDGDVMLVIGG